MSCIVMIKGCHVTFSVTNIKATVDGLVFDSIITSHDSLTTNIHFLLRLGFWMNRISALLPGIADFSVIIEMPNAHRHIFFVLVEKSQCSLRLIFINCWDPGNQSGTSELNLFPSHRTRLILFCELIGQSLDLRSIVVSIT